MLHIYDSKGAPSIINSLKILPIYKPRSPTDTRPRPREKEIDVKESKWDLRRVGAHGRTKEDWC